jgi:hypothetical protein
VTAEQGIVQNPVGYADHGRAMIVDRLGDATVMTRFKAGLMKPDIHEPSGTLVLRAWVEGESLRGLRVKITQIRYGSDPTITMTTTIDTTCVVVEGWLRGLATNSGPPPPSR